MLSRPAVAGSIYIAYGVVESELTLIGIARDRKTCAARALLAKADSSSWSMLARHSSRLAVTKGKSSRPS